MGRRLFEGLLQHEIFLVIHNFEVGTRSLERRKRRIGPQDVRYNVRDMDENLLLSPVEHSPSLQATQTLARMSDSSATILVRQVGN